MIIVRFVRHDDILSDMIIEKTGGQHSHAESLTPEGTIIGAYAEGLTPLSISQGGVRERPANYDGGKFVCERYLALPADSDTTNRYYHYLRACIGEPYGFFDLSSFVLPDIVASQGVHIKHHVFCSMLVMLALRGCGWLPNLLSVPAHFISPRDAELVISSRPGVTDWKPKVS